jgi:hypothetical protein
VPDNKLLNHLNPRTAQEYLKCMLTIQQFYDVVNHCRRVYLFNGVCVAVECDGKPLSAITSQIQERRLGELEITHTGRSFKSSVPGT